MKLYLRLLKVMIGYLYNRYKIDPRDPFERDFKVLRTDLDFINMHLTNSRYTAFLDLVSLEFMLRSGLIGNARKHRYSPVLGSTYIRFRKELSHKDKFTIKLEVVAVKDGWVYLDYSFVKDDIVYCHAIQRAGFYKRREGLVPISRVMDETGYHVEYKNPPAYVRELINAENEFKDEIKVRSYA